MTEGKFVSYLRVGTAKQGGLDLDAQRKAVADFLDGRSWTIIQEVIEVESGKPDDRPKLTEALALCRVHGARLLIAKLDRLSRDAYVLIVGGDRIAPMDGSTFVVGSFLGDARWC